MLFFNYGYEFIILLSLKSKFSIKLHNFITLITFNIFLKVLFKLNFIMLNIITYNKYKKNNIVAMIDENIIYTTTCIKILSTLAFNKT